VLFRPRGKPGACSGPAEAVAMLDVGPVSRTTGGCDRSEGHVHELTDVRPGAASPSFQATGNGGPCGRLGLAPVIR